MQNQTMNTKDHPVKRIRELKAYLKGQIFKYVFQEEKQGGLNSLKQGADYLDRLISLVELNPFLDEQDRKDKLA